jgi:hypothetical protein|tara:strand:- start:416 stop:742 length:327 start_codon:yes stop_codon:yes gene_type:complete
MTTDKRRKAISKFHKNLSKKSRKKSRSMMEKAYQKLKTDNPNLSENELEALLIEQQRIFKIKAKEKFEKKQEKLRAKSRERNSKSKKSSAFDKSKSIYAVQGGRVSPR